VDLREEMSENTGRKDENKEGRKEGNKKETRKKGRKQGGEEGREGGREEGRNLPIRKNVVQRRENQNQRKYLQSLRIHAGSTVIFLRVLRNPFDHSGPHIPHL
jgi:hypothetical protein